MGLSRSIDGWRYTNNAITKLQRPELENCVFVPVTNADDYRSELVAGRLGEERYIQKISERTFSSCGGSLTEAPFHLLCVRTLKLGKVYQKDIPSVIQRHKIWFWQLQYCAAFAIGEVVPEF